MCVCPPPTCTCTHISANAWGGQRYRIPWSYHPRNLWVTQCGHWDRNLRSRDQTLDPVLARWAWVNHSLRLSTADMNTERAFFTSQWGKQGAATSWGTKPQGCGGGSPGDPKQSSGALELPQLAGYSQRSLGKEEKIGIPYALCLDASHPPGTRLRDQLPGLCSYLTSLGSSAAGRIGFSPDLFMDGPGTPSTKFLERIQTSFV